MYLFCVLRICVHLPLRAWVESPRGEVSSSSPPPHKPLGPAWLHPLVLAEQGPIFKTGKVQCLVLSFFRFPTPVFGKVPIFTHCVEYTDFSILTLLTSSLGCCRFLEVGLGIWWNFILLALQRKSVPQTTGLAICSSLDVPKAYVTEKISFQMHTPWQQALTVSTSWPFCALES